MGSIPLDCSCGVGKGSSYAESIASLRTGMVQIGLSLAAKVRRGLDYGVGLWTTDYGRAGFERNSSRVRWVQVRGVDLDETEGVDPSGVK